MKKLALAWALPLLGMSPTVSSAQEPITLSWAAHYSSEQMAPLTACFRKYEADNPGITIRYQQTGFEDFLQAQITSKLANATPDILNVYSEWGKRLADSGVLAVPPADILQFIDAAYEPSTVEGAKINGQVYGVPAEVSLYMLLYNKKLFAKAGIDKPPTTWAEVIADAAKIAERDANGKVVTAGYAFGPSPGNATHPFRAFMFSAGLPLIKEDGLSTNLTSPAAAEILQNEVELFRQGSTSLSNVVKDFPSGHNGMQIMANWFEQTLREGLGDEFDATVGVAPIPAGPDWKTYQYSFYQSVAAGSPHADAAWKLIRWLNSPKADGSRSCMGDMVVTLGGLTANKHDIAKSQAELGDSFTKPYVDALQSGHALTDRNIAQTGEVDRILRSYIEAAWLGKLPPVEALAKADADIANALAQPN